jgi:hypothetical protein
VFFRASHALCHEEERLATVVWLGKTCRETSRAGARRQSYLRHKGAAELSFIETTIGPQKSHKSQKTETSFFCAFCAFCGHAGLFELGRGFIAEREAHSLARTAKRCVPTGPIHETR